MYELRIKINELDNDLAKKKEDLSRITSELNDAKLKVLYTQKKLNDLTEELMATQEYNDQEMDGIKDTIKTTNLNWDNEFQRVKNQFKDQLLEKDSEINAIKTKYKQALSEKDSEINIIKTQFDQTIESKEKIIERLNRELKEKEKQFVEQIHAQNISNFVEKIKDTMKFKGFLSDREFDVLYREKFTDKKLQGLSK